ncbi:MAG: prepilin-type N-terminal cleavage/methylation domain-containing protein [Candidatus Nomurabacteria bacterium]|nr:MAG: prepilin-type N-terminal cleavage/methylation domain-containing protein [Candidatus Nomurabacteria bacterium]
MGISYRQKGFTIVELLIVIVVIGILAAIVVVAYNGVTTHAADAKRSDELTSLVKVLEIYHAEHGAYPLCGATGPDTTHALTSGTVSSCLADDLVPTYISTMPADPVDSGSNIYYYAAGYQKTGTTTFVGNNTDNFILGNKQATSTGPYYSGWGKSDLTLLLGS